MVVVSAILLQLLFASLLAAICLIPALRNAKRRRLAENLPVSKTAGVFIGLVKLKGTVETGSPPFLAYLTGRECVHYTWSVAEEWRRVVTETYRDKDGRTRTRTRVETGWQSVATGGESTSFYLQDDLGIIQIRPEGAKLELLETLNYTCGTDDPLYYGKGPDSAIADSTHRRRFSEAALPLHHPLYVIGQVRERADMVAPEIAYDKQAPMFLVSTRSEEQVKAGLSWKFWGQVALGFALACIFLGGPIGAVAYLLVLAGGWVWMVFNSTIYLRQRVRQAWSEVAVQLKRRADLVPKLVTVVTAYCQHEAGLQAEIAAIHARIGPGPTEKPENRIQGLKQAFAAIAERYPNLKANRSFLDLQLQLSNTETRIALARGYFNDIATRYNVRLEVIPDRYIVRLGGMRRAHLLQADDFDRPPTSVFTSIAKKPESAVQVPSPPKPQLPAAAAIVLSPVPQVPQAGRQDRAVPPLPPPPPLALARPLVPVPGPAAVVPPSGAVLKAMPPPPPRLPEVAHQKAEICSTPPIDGSIGRISPQRVPPQGQHFLVNASRSYSARRFAEAIAIADHALQLNSRDPDLWWIKAMSEDQLQNGAPATEAFEQFLRLSNAGNSRYSHAQDRLKFLKRS